MKVPSKFDFYIYTFSETNFKLQVHDWSINKPHGGIEKNKLCILEYSGMVSFFSNSSTEYEFFLRNPGVEIHFEVEVCLELDEVDSSSVERVNSSPKWVFAE